MSEASAVRETEGSKWHRFFTGQVFTNLRIAFKPALAITITLAIGQNTKVASIEGSTMYLSAIFATLFMPNKTRIQMIENTVAAGILIAAVVPVGMLGFLCAKATRNPATDLLQFQAYAAATAANDLAGQSPAVFYQGRPAAVAAVFLFILAWAANVLKTLFMPFIFPIVASAIIGGVLLLEGEFSKSTNGRTILMDDQDTCFQSGLSSILS